MLAAYLDVMKARGVTSAELVLGPSAQGGDATLRVVFDVTQAPLPGDKPEPGGWKSPANLDRDPLEGEVP